jgi:chromosome segregation ATPase
MRPRLLVLALLPLLAFGLIAGACGEDDDAAATRDNVEREAREQIELIDDRIADLEEQVRGTNVDDRVKRELDSLKDERDSLEDKLRQARDDSDGTWQDFKREFNAAMEDLNQELETLWAEIKARFDDDDAPGQGGDQ